MLTNSPAEAQTWINQQIKFTHGYGIVMSPVNRVTPDGLPELFIRNIPPVSTVDLEIDEPRIYYGEATANYIFTGTTTDEFDYPPWGMKTPPTVMMAPAALPLNSWLRQLAYAFDLGNLRLLISDYFTSESRIHYHRLIQDRVRQVTPFLTFDSDPYIAVIDGRLKWILDGYTTSNRYPYSEPFESQQWGCRHCDGQSDGAAAQRYQLPAGFGQGFCGCLRRLHPIFRHRPSRSDSGHLPENFSRSVRTRKYDAPPNYREHLRYPQDFFTAQAQMYRAYHMENPEVFYNREDLWRFPERVSDGVATRMESYYIIMRLPNFDGAEFMQILPFTPVNKDNMVAWMAGGSDGENYGNLLLYEFPKQELVYGPNQIEARIDQTPRNL